MLTQNLPHKWDQISSVRLETDSCPLQLDRINIHYNLIKAHGYLLVGLVKHIVMFTNNHYHVQPININEITCLVPVSFNRAPTHQCTSHLFIHSSSMICQFTSSWFFMVSSFTNSLIYWVSILIRFSLTQYLPNYF